MQPAVLFGLLGATVVAAVSSMPADNRNHNEEMVTRCIIEVLSNALSKFNAPPITPECRQILKKSGKELKDEEKNENENTKFEVRLLRDSADTSEAHRPPSRENPGIPGEEDTGPSVADTEGGGHSREGAGEPHGRLDPFDSHVSKEAKTLHSEKNEEEDREGEEGEKYQKREHGEDGSEEKHQEEPGKTQNAFLDKRNEATTKTKEEVMSRYDTHAARLPAEKSHSRETSSQESREETRNQEEHPQDSKSRSGSQEDSEESEGDASHEMVKASSRTRHYLGQGRPDRAFQGRNPPSEEWGQPREQSEEPNVGMASLGDKRDRYPTHYRALEAEPEYGDQVQSYAGVQAPENLEQGRYERRGNKYRVPRPPSDEGQEQGDKRSHPSPGFAYTEQGYSEESEEDRGPEWGYRPRAPGGQPGAYSTADKGEKRFLGEGHYHVRENQMDEARRHLQGEWKEQDRNYLNYGEENGEEGAQGTWPQPEDLQDAKENKEDARLPGKQYAPYHTSEKRKRLGELLLSPYYAPAQWKSGHFERKDSMDDNFLDGEEENGLTLNEKNFFPEYNYDWWEKKPFEEDVNWGYENRNPAPKLDLKRQYDRVAQLDQLLHYRKKSAEFPDFYDSDKQLSPHHTAENEKDRAGPGVLTEEEEKELENLAAMDLELQKIAEKFSNRRG
ncbi:secretogranin-1 [Saccopteryx leptura]|uniref:secretogranin-1 n=1 Tax=Saccopteryx leptura TaxID=249018 RepID=UPI00339BD231